MRKCATGEEGLVEKGRGEPELEKRRISVFPPRYCYDARPCAYQRRVRGVNRVTMPIVCAEFVAGVTDVREAVINPARWRPLDTQGGNVAKCLQSHGTLVLDKPKFSTFDAKSVVDMLVPDLFETNIPMSGGTLRMQKRCLEWVIGALERFQVRIRDKKTAIGSVSSEAESPATVQQELRDCQYVSRWFADAVRDAMSGRRNDSTGESTAGKQPTVSLLAMLIPVINRVAFGFGGDLENLVENIRKHAGMLEAETLIKRIYTRTFYDENEFVNALVAYERHTLPRILRVVVASCLQRSPCAYGTLPAAAAFALGVLRHVWCNMKLDMYTRMEVNVRKWR